MESLITQARAVLDYARHTSLDPCSIDAFLLHMRAEKLAETLTHAESAQSRLLRELRRTRARIRRTAPQ